MLNQCSGWCKNPHNGIKHWVKRCRSRHYLNGFKYCPHCEFGYKYYKEKPTIIYHETSIKLRCFCCGHLLRHGPNMITKSKIYSRKRELLMVEKE